MSNSAPVPPAGITGAPPPAAPSHMRQLPATIAQEEYEAIAATHGDNPPTRYQLVGLAFSGGGIRSATFGLGVLEGLKKLGPAEAGPLPVDRLWWRLYRRLVQRQLPRPRAPAERRLPIPPTPEPLVDQGATGPVDRVPARLLQLPVAAGRLLQRRHLVHVHVWLRNALLVQWTVHHAVACVLLLPRLAALVFGLADGRQLALVRRSAFIVSVAGIAGNQQRVSRGQPAWLLKARRTGRRAGAGRTVFCAAASATGPMVGFDPFGTGDVPGYRRCRGVPRSWWAAIASCRSWVTVLRAGQSSRPPAVELQAGARPVVHRRAAAGVRSFFFGAVLWARPRRRRERFQRARHLRRAVHAGLAATGRSRCPSSSSRSGCCRSVR